jgi:hypothetical protein
MLMNQAATAAKTRKTLLFPWIATASGRVHQAGAAALWRSSSDKMTTLQQACSIAVVTAAAI